jgi:hypothetical protein
MNPNEKTIDGYNALHLAVKTFYYKSDIVKYLLCDCKTNPYEKINDGHDVLSLAYNHKHNFNCLFYLIKLGVLPNNELKETWVKDSTYTKIVLNSVGLINIYTI